VSEVGWSIGCLAGWLKACCYPSVELLGAWKTCYQGYAECAAALLFLAEL